jgi:hypothetical protein
VVWEESSVTNLSSAGVAENEEGVESEKFHVCGWWGILG